MLNKKVKIEVEFDVSVELLAKQFANLDDDAQAQFFCIAAKYLKDYSDNALSDQAYYIGKHLKTCECSTPEGRQFISEINSSME